MDSGFNKQTPWHDVVKRLDQVRTVEQAITEADLGRFVVRETQPNKRELFCQKNGSLEPTTSLGPIWRDTVPLQIDEAFALFQPLLDLGCLCVDCITLWEGTQWVWMVFKISKCEGIEDHETIQPFLLFGHNPLNNSFRLRYLFVRYPTNGVLLDGAFHNPEPRIPYGRSPREFSANNEQVCELIQMNSTRFINVFRQMSRVHVSPDEADQYLLNIARRLPKDGKITRRTHLCDDQISKFYSACKDQLYRLGDDAQAQTPMTLWDAYNAVIDWVDREAGTLEGWKRLSELWRSGIKDDALYEALKRMGLTRRNAV